jgi:trk system potassium uptake protein TrkA
VNVKAAATDEIHRNIRQGNLVIVKGLHGINAEIIEVEAGKNCEILERPLKNLKFPKGMIIGALLSGDNVEIATGDTVIKKGDRVILFVQPQAIQKVEELFHD